MKERFQSIHIAGKEVLYAGMRRQSADAVGVVIQAHPDDRTMAQGSDSVLIRNGVGLVVVTMLDGAAGKVYPPISPHRLAKQRLHEDHDSAVILGADALYNAQLPFDGALTAGNKDACDIVQRIIKIVNPSFVIAPHFADPHPDHASAYGITLASVGEIPVYAMDGMLGKDNQNNPIRPTHYIPITLEDKENHDKGYSAHRGQVENRRKDEQDVIHAVREMPRIRGTELRRQSAFEEVIFAAGLVYEGDTDPVAEIMGGDIYIREREKVLM